MEPVFPPQPFNGLNLDNYYPKHVSYNSVVYVHKRCLNQSKERLEKEKLKKESKDKKVNKKKNKKCDKGQQVEDVNLADFNNTFFNNTVLTHPVQIGRQIIPVLVPPNGIESPVYYTIKATKKAKKKSKDISNITYKKERSKKIIETYRNDKGSQKESLSVKETISYMSQSDTLDEIHLNPSLCCTFSDVSEQKHAKKDIRQKPKLDNRLAPSESFEALAAELMTTTGDTKIKIHLMNDLEKNLLAENIRLPLMKAIKECVLEINNQTQYHQNAEITTVQKFVKCNTQKLDNVMDKLTTLEQKIEKLDKYNAKDVPAKVSKQQNVAKASTLEQLSEDLLELKEPSSGDEYYPQPTVSARKKARGMSAVVELELEGDRRGELGAGEEGTVDNPTGSKLKPDRPNRIPARFCWTDAAKKNAG